MLRTHKHTRAHKRCRRLHKHSITVHMLHSLWPDPLRSLALSSHSYAVFPIFRFLPLLSGFLVSPQLGKRLHRGGLIGFASWVGCFFLCHCAKDMGAAGVGQLVGAKNPRCRDQCCGCHLMLFSVEAPTWWSHLRRAGGLCLFAEGRVKDRNVIFEDTKRKEE